MNLIHALTQLGFENQTDFRVDVDETFKKAVITEWNSNSPRPSQEELDAAWTEWLAVNATPLADLKTIAKMNIDQAAERASEHRGADRGTSAGEQGCLPAMRARVCPPEEQGAICADALQRRGGF